MVEHDEISRYRTLIALAKQLGHLNVVSLLKATLDEPKATDHKLKEPAQLLVNRQPLRKGRTTKFSRRPRAQYRIG